jgi:hypothetical protein
MCNNTQPLHEEEEARINRAGLAMRAANKYNFFFHAFDPACQLSRKKNFQRFKIFEVRDPAAV